MKARFGLLTIFILLSISLEISPQKVKAQNVSVSFNIFHEQLSPYGRWISYRDYGQVWIPNVPRGFHPYSTSGHWAYTDNGWTWISDFEWGWAPFHYGRWMLDEEFGWMWVPDYEWGPAWVVWRHSPGYYGWAPLAPRVSIEIAFGRHYIIPNEHWCFVPERHIAAPHIDRYYLPRTRIPTIIGLSTVINRTHFDKGRHTTYVYGPERTEVEQFRGKKLNPVIIHDYDRPGHNYTKGNLYIYKPDFHNQKTIRSSYDYVPSKSTTPRSQSRNVQQVKPKIENKRHDVIKQENKNHNFRQENKSRSESQRSGKR